MANARRIAIITSSRADYGLLFWILRELQQAPEVRMQLVVTGTHLSPAFGHTVDQIVADGFEIAFEADLIVDGDSNWATVTSAGLGMIGLGNAFRTLRSDMVLLLGDRFEILSAAFAASIAHVPIAHLHGGEVTTGAMDDCIRHAITKLARMHLASTVEHGRRIVQMGEQANWVHVVGEPGIENITRLTLDDRGALEARLGYKLKPKLFILTYHPATAADEDPVQSVEAILSAIERFDDATVIATGSNADAGGRAVIQRLRDAVPDFQGRLHFHDSLGQTGYLSALSLADVVIGNSSSGLIEAPSCGTPTVNVGTRQDGRPRALSVIDCPVHQTSITMAIERALSPEMQDVARQRQNPYAAAGLDIAKRTAKLLTEVDLEEMRKPKSFVDLAFA